MNVLRRLPLSQLVLLCAAVVALGTGVAVASSIGSGPTPPPTSLAEAVHQALTAAPVGGVTADVTLTDSLLPSGTASGTSSPLLSGASGRLWVTADGQARLELQSGSGDTEIYYSHGTLSYYDPRNGGTLYNVVLPSRSGSSDAPAATHAPPSIDAIQQTIDRLSQHASVSGAIAGDVAGQPTYEVRVSPSRDGGLFGGAALWWDADHGVPLQIALYAVNNPSPVLDLSATSVSYGPVDPSVFAPPIAAKTENIDLSSHAGDHAANGASSAAGAPAGLSFTPSEPATLDGQTLTSKRIVHVDGHAAELLFYGHGLGGIAVLERATPAATSATSPGSSGGGQGDQSGQSLPTVSVNGVTATEIPTALGTLVQFSRGGVSYTVVGSVPTADAVRAADGL
jgi:hypothetical protein